MAIPKATLTLSEGALGIPPEQTDNLLVVFGYCSAGTTGAIYDFDGASPSTVKAQLGVGRLAQLVAAILATPNHGPVKAVPLASTAGVNSAVAETGTAPPDITLTGTPHDDYEGRVEIVTAGSRGVATFRYSLDAGNTWSPELVTAATYEIPDSGVTLNFATGTDYDDDNRYSWTSTAPTHSTTQVTDGIQAVIDAGTDFGWGYVTASPGGATNSDRATALASLFTAVSAKVDALEAAYKYVGFTIEGPRPVMTGAAPTSSELTAWRTAIKAAVASLSHKRMMIAPTWVRRVDEIGGWQSMRSGGWSVAERISQAPISEHLGRVRSGPLRAIVSLEHDEEATGGLDDARFTTLRTIAGRQGFYITRGRQFASAGSDYGATHRLRVINTAAKVGRNALLSYLNDDVVVDEATGRIREDEAQAIDSDLTNQLEAALKQPRHASSVAGRVSRADDILSTETLTGEFAVQPKGYAETIRFSLGFTKSTQAAA